MKYVIYIVIYLYVIVVDITTIFKTELKLFCQIHDCLSEIYATCMRRSPNRQFYICRFLIIKLYINFKPPFSSIYYPFPLLLNTSISQRVPTTVLQY